METFKNINEYKEKLMARNYFAFNDFSESEKGNFIVKGILTKFNDENANLNGYVYNRGCYNDFCKKYYEQKERNIPVDLLHNTMDINHLVGKVLEFHADDNQASIVVEISKYAILFNNVKGLIEEGILQGFSDYSYIEDGYYDNQKNLLIVNKCNIVSVSLVPDPAVIDSNLIVTNATKFFFKEINKVKEDDEDKKKSKSFFFGL